MYVAFIINNKFFLLQQSAVSQCNYKSNNTSIATKLHSLAPEEDDIIDIPPSPPPIKQEIDTSPRADYKESYHSIGDTLPLQSVS